MEVVVEVEVEVVVGDAKVVIVDVEVVVEGKVHTSMCLCTFRIIPAPVISNRVAIKYLTGTSAAALRHQRRFRAGLNVLKIITIGVVTFTGNNRGFHS